LKGHRVRSCSAAGGKACPARHPRGSNPRQTGEHSSGVPARRRSVISRVRRRFSQAVLAAIISPNDPRPTGLNDLVRKGLRTVASIAVSLRRVVASLSDAKLAQTRNVDNFTTVFHGSIPPAILSASPQKSYHEPVKRGRRRAACPAADSLGSTVWQINLPWNSQVSILSCMART